MNGTILKQGYQDLLTPENINSVSGLSLIARVLVSGSRHGLHQSRRLGQGMEFSQYRGYEPGDDLRLLDWKMLARSGRYYIKQAEVDTQISVKFIVDSSKSMEHQEEQFSKLEFARILIASLAYLCQQQGDAVGLFALNDKKMFELSAKADNQHFNRLLLQLLQIKSAGKWPKNPVELERLHDRGRKELLFFISDLHEGQQEITSFIKALKTARNEVIVLHLMGHQELNFNYKGTFTFEDLETGRRMKINAKAARKSYLEALNQQIAVFKKEFLAKGIDYELVDLKNPISEILPLFLKKRSRLL